jgi:hypothetical protein
MNKEFVSYRQSLELKELGFDELCIACYDKLNMLATYSENLFEPKNYNTSGYCVSSPLYQQAFRWFREKGYDIKIEKEYNNLYFGFYWTGVCWVLAGKGYYEECELECLKKLISIVKEQQNETIYLIPTDKPSRLFTDLKGKLMFNNDWTEIPIGRTNQYIYITSDEEIKQGDYVCTSGGFRFVKTLNKDKAKTFKDDGIVSKQNPSSSCHLSNYKKIILTTDPDLIKDGVQAIDDDFLEWFVKNSSCKYVEIAKGKMKLNDDNQEYGFPDMSLYKIIIPQEEPKQSSNFYEDLKKHFENTPKDKLLEEWEKSAESDKVGPTVEEFLNNSKQETLEEAARIWNESFDEYDEFVKKHNTNIQNSFIAGAQWQQERSYSKKDLISFAFFYFKEEFNSVFEDPKSIEEIFILWFEQFKKK